MRRRRWLWLLAAALLVIAAAWLVRMPESRPELARPEVPMPHELRPEERQRMYTRKAFQQYVSPEVVERIFDVQSAGRDLVLGIGVTFGVGYGLNSPRAPIASESHDAAASPASCPRTCALHTGDKLSRATRVTVLSF